MMKFIRTFQLLVAALALLPLSVHAQAKRTPALALEVPPHAVTFLAIGDWGRQGEPPQQAVADAMAAIGKRMDAQFIVALGDNIYPDGVASINDPLWETSFNRVYHQYALQVPWYVLLGNHDYRGSPQAELDYSKVSRRWRLPARYYSVRIVVDDTTTADLFMFDTTPLINQYYTKEPGKHAVVGVDTVAQRVWADSALGASNAKWKLAFAHHHIYTGAGRETQKETESFFVPRFERYGVQAWFSGHEHALQHIVKKDQKTQYFISGAGSEWGPEEHKGVAQWYGKEAGFAAVSLTAKEMLVQFVNPKGVVVYKTRVPR